jgi:hypothetical protein
MKNITTIFFILLVSCAQQDVDVKRQVDLKSYLIKDKEVIEELDKWNPIKEYTLTDSELKMNFVLDSLRINISAYDFSNNLVWKTDPWFDNKLIPYKLKRPRLIYYSLKANWRDDDKKFIWISYNSTQFGAIDRRTGKFHYMGKD